MTSNIKMNFIERPGLTKLLYISKMSDSQLMGIFMPDVKNEINRKTGKKLSKDDIKLSVNCIKKYVRNAIACNGEVIKEYEYKTTGKPERAYVKGIGFQNLRAEVRDFLTQDKYYDVDMCNFAPTIIKYLCDKNNVMCPTLDLYVADREAFIKKYCPAVDKHQILIQGIFAKRSSPHALDPVKNIYKEVAKLKRALFKGDPSTFSSKLSKLTHQYENKLLMSAVEVIGQDNIGALIFDGLLAENVNDDTIDTINNLDIVKKYGIKFKIKEPFFEHKLDFSNLSSSATKRDYETIKEDFEKRNCKVNIPVNYIEEYNDTKTGEEKFHIHQDITKRYEDLYYVNITKDGQEEELFIGRWLKDPTKRVYKEVAFAPYSDPSQVHPCVYNTFRGFNATNQDYFEEPKWFLDHLDLITNKECTPFLLNYITHLIQKPWEKPQVGIVLKGMQGTGKDALIDTLVKIIGKAYCHRTSTMSCAFGSFTSSLKQSLLYIFNEVKGKQGFENADAIKDLITREEHNINEKHIREYKVENSVRCFFLSNNLTPLDIPPDDRRFVVYRTADKREAEYYNTLYEKIEDNEEINNLYSYLMSRDIITFKPWVEQRVQQTHNYKIMKEMSIPSLYYFLRQYQPALSNDTKLGHKIYADYLLYCNKRYIKTDHLQYQNSLKMMYELKGIKHKRSNKGVIITFTSEFNKALQDKYFTGVIDDKDCPFLSDSEEEQDEGLFSFESGSALDI